MPSPRHLLFLTAFGLTTLVFLLSNNPGFRPFLRVEAELPSESNLNVSPDDRKWYV